MFAQPQQRQDDENGNVGILVADGWNREQLEMVAQTARGLGRRVVFVGEAAGTTYPSFDTSATVICDVAAADADPEDFAAVAIPGGWTADALREHRSVVLFVRRVHAAGGIVLAVERGCSLVVSAGLAGGRRLTSNRSIRDDLRYAGGDWVDEPVVYDGDLLTAQGSDDLQALGETFAQLLERVPAEA